MRGTWIAIAVLVIGIAASSARAGVYHTADVYPYKLPENFREFRMLHAELGTAAYDRSTRAALCWLLATTEVCPQSGVVPLRFLGSLPFLWPDIARPTRSLHFCQQATVLEKKQQQGDLTRDDRINLSAYLLYLNEPQRAVSALQPALDEKKPHFMVLANLATAYEMLRIPERALDYRRQALASWPTIWAGWTTAQLNWYRRVEMVHLTLLQLRAPQMVRTPPRVEVLDPIFPRVKFVGPSGEYEPGTIAPEYALEIPPDAVPLVTQLLIWMPNDNRLYWLLGELLNAQGDVVSAATVFQELVIKKEYTSAKELREHRKELEAARPFAEVFARDMTPALSKWLLIHVAPRGAGLAPGVGGLAYESGLLAEVHCEEKWGEIQGTVPAAPRNSENSAPLIKEDAPPAWLPNWRHITVAFVAGMIIGPLVLMQWREIRRRRQAWTPAPRGGE